MIEVLKQALEALETYHGYMEPLLTVFGGPRVPAEQSTTSKVEKAITSLRQAIREHAMYEVQRLGQEIEQEPVAITDDDGVAWAFGTKWGKLPANKILYDKPYDVFEHLGYCPECGASPDNPQPHPPQRTWVGLTDEEREKHRNDWHSNIHDKEFKAIEAKLKEKNS